MTRRQRITHVASRASARTERLEVLATSIAMTLGGLATLARGVHELCQFLSGDKPKEESQDSSQA